MTDVLELEIPIVITVDDGKSILVAYEKGNLELKQCTIRIV